MNTGFTGVTGGVFFTFLAVVLLSAVLTVVFLLVEGFFANGLTFLEDPTDDFFAVDFVAFFIISYPLASWQYIMGDYNTFFGIWL
jgi:hypothetical protein